MRARLLSVGPAASEPRQAPDTQEAQGGQERVSPVSAPSPGSDARVTAAGTPSLGAGRALFEQQGLPACKLSLYLVPQTAISSALQPWSRSCVLPSWGHGGMDSQGPAYVGHVGRQLGLCPHGSTEEVARVLQGHSLKPDPTHSQTKAP